MTGRQLHLFGQLDIFDGIAEAGDSPASAAAWWQRPASERTCRHCGQVLVGSEDEPAPVGIWFDACLAGCQHGAPALLRGES